MMIARHEWIGALLICSDYSSTNWLQTDGAMDVQKTAGQTVYDKTIVCNYRTPDPNLRIAIPLYPAQYGFRLMAADRGAG
jgi:hypothetical protein